MRDIIYPFLKQDRPVDAQVPANFVYQSSETVRYPLSLSGKEQIADLLAMTPHLYRASAEGRAKAAALTEIEITVDVRLTCFKRDTKQIK